MLYRAGASLLLAVTLILASSCGGEASLDDDARYSGVADQESLEMGKADGSADPLRDQLKAKYGVRPRRYTGLVDGTNEAEQRLMAALPQVTEFCNQRLREAGADYDLHESEIITNFVTEGGYYLLTENITAYIDGFGALGIDTLVDNYEALKPWLSADVQQLVEDGSHTRAYINELGQTVHTLTNLTLEQGLYANAGMFAYYKFIAAKNLLAKRNVRMSSLPARGQFFWNTMYFNAGEENASRRLSNNGAYYYNKKWTRADDSTVYGGNAQYNALWRTASWEYLYISIYQ